LTYPNRARYNRDSGAGEWTAAWLVLQSEPRQAGSDR